MSPSMSPLSTFFRPVSTGGMLTRAGVTTIVTTTTTTTITTGSGWVSVRE